MPVRGRRPLIRLPLARPHGPLDLPLARPHGPLDLRLCGFALWLACFALACAPELEKLPQRRSARGSFGEEVYKAVCRRVAGTELPLDVAGTRSEAICLGDTGTVQQALSSEGTSLPTRLLVLAQRRPEIVQAVDDMFPTDALSDELEHLFRGVLPFYEPPEERVQNATRAVADVMRALANPGDARALSGLARLAQKGVLAREGALGLTRAPLAASGLRDMGRSVLPLTQDEPAVAAHFNTLLDGLALELATIDPDEAPDSDIQRLKRLLLRTHPDFGSGTPLFSSVRDPRGLPVPLKNAGALPFPFVDADGDKVADASGSVLATSTGKPAPAPFPTVGEGQVGRDAFGRAFALAADGSSDASRLMYESSDADVSLLGGAMRALQKLIGDESFAQNMSLVSSSIVGEHTPSSRRYGNYDFQYLAPTVSPNPLLDLVHGSTALLDRDVLPSSLALTENLFNEHEAALAEAVAPLVSLERITRPGVDPYPEAKLPAKSTFWDELLFEFEKIARRRNSAGGETLLEALLRAALGYARNLGKPGAPIEQLVDPELLRHQGVVLASMMRFKDEWRSNPKGESERAADEPLVLGGFRQAVDRQAPDSPVTCGKDGCGGLIAGTPFERWKKPNQNCQIQRLGRPISGRDCGAPANQSIFQRSLGLITEMAGRSQCNKAITIGDLLDYAVLEDPCLGKFADGSPECEVARRNARNERNSSIQSAETSVRNDYACPGTGPCAAYIAKYPAAFVDPDGVGTGVAASIQACHMLDLPDVGRTFGAAVTHEFQLEIPNPWVRRYLEDVARAGDHDGDGSADLPACAAGFKIDDPTVAPPCITESASLSRDLYTDMPITVDTLGELVEFLLDDSTLFTTDEDTRDLRPDVRSLSRVLFAPAGSTSFIIFDPLLVRGSPSACSAGGSVPECANDDTAVTPPEGCCIKDPTRPPLRYRLDTYYGATSFAWEHQIQLTDGRNISFLDTMRTLSDAVARFDYRLGVDDPKDFEDTDYVFTTLGKLLAEHYDSARNASAQASDPNGRNYRRLTGIVNYEALMADALDDGTIDLAQPGADGAPLYLQQKYTPDQQLGLLYHSLPVMQALDAMSVEGGADGIDISVEVAEQLLNPHAHCAGATGDRRVIDGIGACDRAKSGDTTLQKPFAYRDGRETLCYRDGRCFTGSPLARRFASPLYLLLDAVDAIDDATNLVPEKDRALRGLVSRVLDAYLQTSDRRFVDRKFRALVVSLLGYFRDRITEERGAGTLASLGKRTDDDAVDFLRNPIIAGALGLLPSLRGRGTAIADLTRYSASLLSEAPGDNQLRPMLAGLFDLVQLLPGDAQTNAALRSTATAFATEVLGAVRGDGSQLHPELGAIGRNLYMLRQTAQLDTAQSSVLERVFKNFARVPAGRASPLEVIVDAALELERKTPGEGTSPSAEDVQLFLTRVADVLTDPRRGFERLYQIVRCTTQSGAQGCE
jgi:hypothetical protein